MVKLNLHLKPQHWKNAITSHGKIIIEILSFSNEKYVYGADSKEQVDCSVHSVLSNWLSNVIKEDRNKYERTITENISSMRLQVGILDVLYQALLELSSCVIPMVFVSIFTNTFPECSPEHFMTHLCLNLSQY